jgi:hypothetical protein
VTERLPEPDWAQRGSAIIAASVKTINFFIRPPLIPEKLRISFRENASTFHRVKLSPDNLKGFMILLAQLVQGFVCTDVLVPLVASAGVLLLHMPYGGFPFLSGFGIVGYRYHTQG